MRVALDAMGGDHAPRELVAGALAAAAADADLHVLLVGHEDKVRAELAEQGGAPANVTVVHASDVIGMEASPVEALRKHPDASILRALQLVRKGEADGVVAAGSTGAAVAATMMTLKRLRGVRRPGIAVPMPARNKHGVCLLLDAGANPACRAHHLHQYAIMGANYYREIFDAESPRVALVSIGEEETKGTTLTKESTKLIRGTKLNFVGNIEGRDLFGGACDVAVADGFVGNIILKSAEGFAEMLLGMVKEELAGKSPQALRDIGRRMDYAEFGGAPLLGVDGIVMICHGRSERRAIGNAIKACARALSHNLNQNIVNGLTTEGANA